MTEPRKLPRGQNQRTALVDSVKAFIGTGDIRTDGVRVQGDLFDSIVDTAVQGLGSEHATRRFAPNTFGGSIDHATRQSRKPLPVAREVDDPELAIGEAKKLLDSLGPELVDALDHELDNRKSAEIVAEAEAEQASSGSEWPWQAADPLPWQGPAYEGYYENQFHAERIAAMNTPDLGEFDMADYSSTAVDDNDDWEEDE